jgi:hypothetical protein
MLVPLESLKSKLESRMRGKTACPDSLWQGEIIKCLSLRELVVKSY